MRLWAAERFFWTQWRRVRYPVASWRVWQKWRSRPRPGDVVEDCQYRRMAVASYGDTEDDLIFTDGSAASWMHCCNWPEEHRGMQVAWRTRSSRQVIVAAEIARSTHGRIYMFIQFRHRVVWLRRPV